MLKLPDSLIEHVRGGKAVLFLGAGASRGAVDAHGHEPPSGAQLGELLADRFLNGKHKDFPLAAIAELAISEHSLSTVQEYIRTLMEGYVPAPHHELIPSFKWWAIATTNYDLIIERAYQRAEEPLQTLVPFIKDGDRVDDKLSTKDSLMYAKLHGCITHTADADIPLILTPDQYVTHRSHRTRLFDHVKLAGFEHPIIFVGSSLQDLDLRQMLLELGSSGVQRPRYYTVTPTFSEAEQRLWDAKRISPIKATFKEFMEALNEQIPKAIRIVLPQLHMSEFPLSKRFASPDATPSQALIRFLETDADFVSESLPIQPVKPKEFYKGNNQGWASIEKRLDVPRGLTDSILADYILMDETDRRSGTEFFVIKAHAGAGKTVCLRRIAWDASVEYNKLCIFLRRNGRLSYDVLDEIWQLTRERIFLFVDNAAEQAASLEAILARARRSQMPLTVLTAERVNEWNMTCERLESFVTEPFTLGYLTHKEILALLQLLEKHNSLGFLQGAPQDERIDAFARKAGRQLLVALHEATLGRPLEDILVDEYKEIWPEPARELYLNICVLNRFDVPVRAGVMARVQGITFSEFKEKLFRPLEHVVQFSYDPIIRDHVFTTRHPHIAEMVFERVLTNSEARHDVYIRLLKALNLDYSVDRVAFRRLVRGRVLLEQFPDYDMAMSIFEAAGPVCDFDAPFHHQLGIYEMNRPNGSLDKAHEYLKMASEMAPYDKAITHSLAELAYEQAENARTELEREKYRKEARELATKLVQNPETPHGHHTLAKLALDRLQEVLADAEAQDRDIQRAIEDVEKHIESGLQRFPNSEYLLTSESRLREVLQDTTRAVTALEKAFAANPRSPYVARRLSECYVDAGRNEDASKTLETAIDANSNDKRLHFAYARQLMTLRPQEEALIEYHLRRSFTQGDHNYDAQFWYARHLYLKGEIPESRARFKQLRETQVAHAFRDDVRGIVTDSTGPRMFSGTVCKTETSYGFVRLDGSGDWLFFHVRDIAPEIIARIGVGTRVRCMMGFSFKGPRAISVVLE